MANNRSAVPAVQVNTTMLAAGAILALIGSLLFGAAILTAVNRWVKTLETPPQEMARQRFQQLQSAASAGARAWREGTGGSTN